MFQRINPAAKLVTVNKQIQSTICCTLNALFKMPATIIIKVVFLQHGGILIFLIANETVLKPKHNRSVRQF